VLVLLSALVFLVASVTPPVHRLHRVELDLPTREQAVLVLRGEGCSALLPPLSTQRLRIAGLEIPVASAPDYAVTPTASRAIVTVMLARVGEGILGIDSSTVEVRWEGLDAKGRLAVALEGTIDLADGEQAVFPTEKLRRHYARLADYGLAPEGMLVRVWVLLGVYNPFSFEVVASGLEYRLEVGETTILSSRRGGFRLRPGQANEVLVEQTLPMLDLASGLAAMLARQPATLTGVLAIRTPGGERGIPILLHSGR